MSVDYNKILDFILVSGKRLANRAGNIADIGITKKDLTEEDVAIERGFDEIIKGFGSDHVLYSEEEHDVFQSAENVWAVDPISSTASFITGRPHYAIVIAHLIHGEAVFAAVYDPSVDELFVAYKGKGAFLNGKSITVTNRTDSVVLRESSVWNRPEVTSTMRQSLLKWGIHENSASMALNYCWVASGRYSGIVSFTKDSFPEFAGGFIIREAGGRFTNVRGESEIRCDDRIFVGGNEKMYRELFPLVENANRQ